MQDFHPLFGVLHGVPAELTIETVGVARGERPAAQALQVGMTHYGFDQPLAETMHAILFVNENIAKVGEDGVIADDARKTDLLFAIIQAEDQRVADGALGAFTRTTRRPIGAREKITNGIDIEPRRVGADGEIIFVDF